MTRRDLIQKVLVGGTTLIVLPTVLTSCSKEEDPSNPGGDPGGGGGGNNLTIDLSTSAYSALNTVGAYMVVQGIIIANAGNNVFLALNSVCTHQGCTIGYSLAENNFPCLCHGSVFSSTGAVVNGPATTGVKSHSVTRNGNILTIAL